MSFILDALKKSEIDRQRQATPGMVESVIVRPGPRLPMWAVALCVLLAINLILLLLVVARGWLTGPHAEAGRAVDSNGTRVVRGGAHAGAGSNPPAAADHFSPLDAPVYAPEIPIASAGDAATAPTLRSPPATLSRQAAASASSGGRAARRRDPVLNEEDFKAADEEVLPSISQINLAGAQALPELHLDVHVFATRPADRFVFINMRKYHEGATLEEGPTVERIRRDGVVLDYQGLRFLLPRQ